jgi:hypothetical protein
MPVGYRKISLLQEDISPFNELSCSYYETGQLKSAILKNKDLAQRNGCALPRKAHEDSTYQSFAMRADERRPGSRLLPMYSDSNVWRCVHWETVLTVTLLHDAVMVHCKARAFARANRMIDMARQMLHSTKQTNKSMHSFMESTKYGVTVVASLYTCTGRVLLRLTKSLPQDKCKSAHPQSQAERLYQMPPRFWNTTKRNKKNTNGHFFLYLLLDQCGYLKRSISLSPDSIYVCPPETSISCDAITSAGAMDRIIEVIVSEYPNERMTPNLLDTAPHKALEPHQKAKKCGCIFCNSLIRLAYVYADFC